MISRVGRHVFALICSCTLFGVIALAVYCTLVIPGAVSAEDLGGPLNFIIIPVVGGVVGAVISIGVYLPLGVLAEQFNFRRWLNTVAIAFGALLLMAIVAWFASGGQWTNRLLLLSSACFCLVGCFFAYLSCLAVCRKVFGQ